MDHNRQLKIMNWNIRGINSEQKWTALASKIDVCGCDIICLQETKRDAFDLEYIRKFCPKKCNKYEYLPSIDASGGIITIWNGSMFVATLPFKNGQDPCVLC